MYFAQHQSNEERWTVEKTNIKEAGKEDTY